MNIKYTNGVVCIRISKNISIGYEFCASSAGRDDDGLEHLALDLGEGYQPAVSSYSDIFFLVFRTDHFLLPRYGNNAPPDDRNDDDAETGENPWDCEGSLNDLVGEARGGRLATEF
jgi:hypothetical protein